MPVIESPTTTGIAIQLNITNIQSDASRSQPLTNGIAIQSIITNIKRNKKSKAQKVDILVALKI